MILFKILLTFMVLVAVLAIGSFLATLVGPDERTGDRFSPRRVLAAHICVTLIAVEALLLVLVIITGIWVFI